MAPPFASVTCCALVGVWAFPLILASIVVGITTAFYMAAVVGPWRISRACRLRWWTRTAES
jgi:hypothetical protein